MTVLTVPPVGKQPWPTLGPVVVWWMQENLCHGPGDLRGEKLRLDQEKQAIIYRLYEVHPETGRRRFRRAAVSVRKGWAKTEVGALITAAELHPAAPVRFARFNGKGDPEGKGVTDPYIPMLAVTEEQSEELAYGALRVILELSRVRDDFDIGIERIMRKGGDGKAVPLANAPGSRDGARTTFQLFDETHRLILDTHHQAYRTMLANLPKRKIADPWGLEITTAPAPGENSVAEKTMEFAQSIATGADADPQLFFFHRYASDTHDIDTPAGLRAAVIEASGPTAEWSDIDGIVQQFADPTADRAFLCRVWLNQLRQRSGTAFDADKWKALARPGPVPADGELIVLGFDGSRIHDATALIGTAVETGRMWVLGIWERPPNVRDWAVPEREVNAKVAEAFQRWDVWRLNADPPYWEQTVANWHATYDPDGTGRVVAYDTRKAAAIATALRAFWNAIQNGEVTHDGHPALIRHIGNAVRRDLGLRDETGQRMWTLEKPREGAWIDGAMAAALCWRARLDAITSGAKKRAWSWGSV